MPEARPVFESLHQLVDAQQAVETAAAMYWDMHIAPKLAECHSQEDLNKLRSEVSLACNSVDGQVRDMPADYSVRFIIATNDLKVVARKVKP
jgi:hypothetical protein